MIKLVSAITAPEPKTLESKKIAYLYAGLLAVLALTQLFTLDEFVKLLAGYNLPGGEVTANLAASLIVTSEVFALPFLLRLKLSPLMRIVSMVLGWLVPLFWFKIALWSVFTGNSVSNYGLLGTLVDLVPGWWTVFISIAIGILAAWASWGLWPLPFKAKSRK